MTLLSSPAAQGGQDLINRLPDECIFLIFSFLPSSRDRYSCATVSKKWLLLQAHMRSSEFRSHPGQTRPNNNKSNNDNAGREKMVSRCLEGKKANDTRLAAMAVGTYARGTLSELSIRGSFPPKSSSSSSSPLQHGVTDLGLKIIAQACPNLKSLSLWDCFKVGNSGLVSIARGCPALEKLDISNSPLVDDHGLVPIAVNCPNLSTLSLESCTLVGDGSLQAFAEHSSRLESISLVKCPLVGDDGIISIVSHLPKLAKVKISSSRVGDAVLEAIWDRGESSIRVLCLENVSGFTCTGFGRVGLAAKLEFLSLRSCAGLTDACFVGIGGRGGPASEEATFVGLKHVTVSNCGALTDKGLISLTESARQLETLRLDKCQGITYMGLTVALRSSGDTLKVLSLANCNTMGELPQQREQLLLVPPKKCPLLETLTLKNCRGIGDAFLSWVGGALVQVKHIAVVGMGSAVTDRGFLSLLTSMGRRNVVESVNLSGCSGITDWSVMALAGASGDKLRHLNLGGCGAVSDRSLEAIGVLCPGLVELDLSRCGRISDGGVAGLLAGGGGGDRAAGEAGRKSRLQMLSLEGCGGITDESLSCLEEMVVSGSLAGLNLKHCRGLSRASLDSVRETLWWCDLIY